MHPVLLALLLATSANAHAVKLRLCTLDHPFPPYTMPDGSGEAQALLRQAAKASGMVIENSYAPRLRCINRLKSGEVDAVLSAFLPERMEYGVFPMANGVADETRAVSLVRFAIYRQAGGSVQWDGSTFAGMDERPVGIQVGLAVAQRLRQTGVKVDEGAKTIEQNLEKLARGRVQAVVALEGEAQPIIEREFKGRIEMLPMAFAVTPIYLHVHPGYFARHRGAVEKLWFAARLRPR
ncbi:substrate-binding periplasmic protein [Pseudoduganella sp. OTU4001]|uniref:substrate-binding periplasmic protein n=1 Tax=Pseudoduganella sp. OTU4001 TaxID=3043854 RepID=UPI00313D22AD